MRGFWIFVHPKVGFALLGLAGAALVAMVGSLANLTLVPFFLLIFSFQFAHFWSEYQKARRSPKRTRGALVYRAFSITIAAHAPLLAIGTIVLAILEGPSRSPADGVVNALASSGSFLMMVLVFAQANVKLNGVKSDSDG